MDRAGIRPQIVRSRAVRPLRLLNGMQRVVIVASAVSLLVGSVNCANSIDREHTASLTAPSTLNPAADHVVVPAGKGGGRNGGDSYRFALMMSADANGNGLPDWGDTVTFDVSTTASTEPHVDLTCSQNGVLVYSATTGYFATYPWPWTQSMTLSSSAWLRGAADCTAQLYYFSGRRTSVIGSIDFTAGE